MPEPFEPVRERLLRSGVAPVHVRRYLRELSEHFSDLVDEERKAGRSAAEAEAAARARLGGDEALAEAMLAQPSLRSWTGRAPWATLVVGPFLLLALAWIVVGLGVAILVVGYPHGAAGPRPPWMVPQWLPTEWMARIGTALFDLVQFGGPLLIGSGVALLAARQRSRLIWPLLGCVAVALLGASVVWDVRWPAVDPRDPLHRVSDSFSLGIRGMYRVDHHNHLNLAVWSPSLDMAAVILAVAGSVYWLARRRMLTVS